MKRIIGVTGGIGSGKSCVSAELSALGAKALSADAISREIMEKGQPAYKEAVQAFGQEILAESGDINRRALAEIVFEDKAKLELLNKITHKFIYKELADRAEKATEKIVCMEIPLLFSSKSPISFYKTIAVVADKEIRIKRILARDKMTREEAEARIKAQLTDEELTALADIVIENNKDLDALNYRVGEVYKEIVNGA